MSLFESLPFVVGQTYFLGGPVTPAIGAADSIYEGAEYFTPDYRPDGTLRSNRLRKLRVVRGMANSGVLLPALLGEFDTTLSSADPNATEYATRIGKLTDGTSHYCYPMDEYLPAGGVTKYDLFYIVTKGPAGVLTAVTAGNTIAWGNVVGGIASGFIDLQATIPTSGNTVGRALSITTSGDAQRTLLVDVGAGMIGG